MKIIYLTRHAKSSWSDGTLRDFDRPLNGRGKRDAPFMANLIKGKGILPDRLISSPANRAITTAGHFAEALGIDPANIEKKQDIYEAYPETLHEIVTSINDDLNTVFLFGHNPGFTSYANRYASEYIPNMPTCSIVCLSSSAESWSKIDPSNTKVTAFFYPKQYL
ncbi:MAG: phosphohistidine phosphatase [Polaribacter sp.]|jgi:phosphohistidine phosphatase